MKKKITYDEALAGRRFASYQEEVDYLKQMMEMGTLIPIFSSGTNGKRPAMYNRYWLVENDRDDTELVEELQYRLSPDISIDYYQRHLKTYEKERNRVLMLSEYLLNQKEKLNTPVSVNERSYEIWKREKFLSGKKEERGMELLKHCGISLEQLNVYRTAEPLSYYTHTRKVPQNLLILENLDPFYGLRKYLLDGHDSVFGLEIGTLIYGGGKRVARAFEEFEILAEPYMKDIQNVVYYVGDMDYEGIGIYERFAQRFSGILQIRPWTLMYERMLEKAGEVEQLPRTKEGQNRNIGEQFFSYFKEKEVLKMKEILSNQRYIPQEILSITDYGKGVSQ